jgi:hypothetical protein
MDSATPPTLQPSRDENLQRFGKLVKEREYKLDFFRGLLENAIHKGYDFGAPNITLYMNVIQLEAQLRELHYALYGVGING